MADGACNAAGGSIIGNAMREPDRLRTGTEVGWLPSADGGRLASRALGGPTAAVRVGLVVPASGPLGLLGPASLNCALLAQQEINARGGMLRRPVELVRVDGGRAPASVAAEVEGLIDAGELDALVGMHTSAVRVAVADAVAGRAPFVYTPPYEGGEQRLGMLCIGETVRGQLGPALRWLVDTRRVRRWFLLGSAYRWPRAAHRFAATVLPAAGANIVGEALLPLGTTSFRHTIGRLVASGADAVLLNLIGQDLVGFHRAARAYGVTRSLVMLSACLEENTLLALGGDDTGELWATMGFFATLPTAEGMAFEGRYAAAFGARAPVTSAHAQSCYEGVKTLATVADRARTLQTGPFDRAAEGTRIAGARGALEVSRRHVAQSAYLAHADGLDFRVTAGL